ncbi:MAG TPA: aspartate aminotransferase family protein [Magnetospirillaceae bacterium]|nr:aspartate aminotransferase family protein [Magnetospirillaceae bacterium]
MIPSVMPTYNRAEFAIDRGEGAYVFTTDGRRLLDFGAGIAVSSLGHGHPRLVKALQDQAAKVWHTSNLYQVPGQDRVADMLVANSFADSVFFCNSGAEANEGVLKAIRKYHSYNGHPEKYRVIVMEGAFHGRTLATLAAGGQQKHLAGFGPVVDGFDRVPFENMNALRDAIGPATAAIHLEPIQGEGGIRPASIEYMKALRATADEFGILLTFDEVQTGVGRTGKLFAHQWADIEPDVVAVAKGLAGGFPAGAILAKEKVAACLTAGSHGTTFGGNPLAMAVTAEVLDIILADGFLDHVQKVAAELKAGLEDAAAEFPRVLGAVNGKGLMLGVKCHVPNTDVAAKLLEGGLLTVGAGDNNVRFIPPLIIEKSHVDEALGIVRRAASELSS